MVEHGFYNFLNWFDDRAWYPLGRIVGGTVRCFLSFCSVPLPALVYECYCKRGSLGLLLTPRNLGTVALKKEKDMTSVMCAVLERVSTQVVVAQTDCLPTLVRVPQA